HLVRQHLEEQYGDGCVAGISNFLKMKGRAAITDVSRVFGVPIKEVKAFTKVINDGKHKDGAIAGAIKETKEGKGFERKYPDIVKFAKQLEGQVRGLGQHAAGIVISAEPLSNGTKCNLINRNESIVINWEMESAEYVGLMKLDILGLNALSVFNETKRLIKENYDKDLDFEDIPLNDSKVLKEFAEGNNEGVFQYNTWLQTKTCKDLEISDFEHLVASNALCRPGPLGSGMFDEFVERKKGKKYLIIHPKIKEITELTYGIAIYQEQVMRLANELAGLSWTEADKMRKVIGKSKGKKEFLKFKDDFISGCIKTSGLSNKQSTELWREIEEFGGYSFNKCLFEETLITLSDETKIKVKELYEDYKNKKLLSCFIGQKKIGENNIKNVFKTGKKKCLKITTKTGKVIYVSKEHKMFLESGREIRAKNLMVKDKLLVVNNN
ncbi:MAG: hypothetical protein KKH44_08465, partial [Bacteroidetes bacterium]|nr:hypothetical protein [Bacteroidota bacterium]